MSEASWGTRQVSICGSVAQELIKQDKQQGYNSFPICVHWFWSQA